MTERDPAHFMQTCNLPFQWECVARPALRCQCWWAVTLLRHWPECLQKLRNISLLLSSWEVLHCSAGPPSPTGLLSQCDRSGEEGQEKSTTMFIYTIPFSTEMGSCSHLGDFQSPGDTSAVVSLRDSLWVQASYLFVIWISVHSKWGSHCFRHCVVPVAGGSPCPDVLPSHRFAACEVVIFDSVILPVLCLIWAADT